MRARPGALAVGSPGWLNFSLKWQSVSLRIPARTPHARGPLEQLALTEHFFRTDDFQRWAMQHRDVGMRVGDWSRYKWPLKTFIHAFDNDASYLKEKLKVPSLAGARRTTFLRGASAVDVDGRRHDERRDKALRRAIAGAETGDVAGGGTRAYLRSRETPLWVELETDGG